MASMTAKVATALSIVAIQMTSKPRIWGPPDGNCCMDTSPPSNLEIDHFGHDRGADTHPDHAAYTSDHQPLIGEEFAHVRRVDHVNEAEDHERQRADDVGRSLRLRAHRPDLQLHLRALSEYVGQVRQGFGKVAARLPLDRERDHEELELSRAEAVRRLLERGLHGAADFHLVGDHPELDAHRTGDFARDDPQRFGDWKTGA